MCGRSCLARGVPGVELREGGVDVIDIELDARHYPVVGVDLGDGDHLVVDLADGATNGHD